MPANSPRMTKVERREAARREAERLAKKQAAIERRNRLVILAVAVVVVALVAVAGVFIYRESQRTLLTDFEGEVPVAATATGGITFGAGAVAGATVPDAPVLQVYVDFMCPACLSFEQVNGEDVKRILEDGDATVVIHPLDFLNPKSTEGDYSTRAAGAFALIASEAPEFAYDFMQGLYDNQPAENGPGLTTEQLSQIALDAGVPQGVVDEIGLGTYNPWVTVASSQARADGVTRTPTILIDGERWGGDRSVPGELYAALTGKE